MAWVAALISSVSLIVVALIEWASNKERKAAKADRERSERRAELRARESQLSMDLLAAACKLSMVSAKKLTGMHTNGDVEEAMVSATEAQAEYADFLREITARQMAKV